MKNKVLFSSQSEEWETPQALFDRLDALYDFALDACAKPGNAKCAHYFTKADDALSRDWSPHGRIWMNPPYGRPIGKWMQKAFEESQKGCLVACLVPARTDTRWWHDWVLEKGSVTFIRGRLRFNRTDAPEDELIYPAPFPNVIVVYKPNIYNVVNGPDGRHGRRAGLVARSAGVGAAQPQCAGRSGTTA